MIEHPEAVTIANQMAETLVGKRIESAMRGNTPHKWAFYNRPAEEYAAILKGKRISGVEGTGSRILLRTGAYRIVLGDGGERILYHPSEDTVPEKHQLLLSFKDGTFLSVKVQGWGACQLFTTKELRERTGSSLSPTEEGFTRDYFMGLFDTLKPDEAKSVKYFLISEPGVSGVGNGYLQDILFRARIHPRTRAVDLSSAQRRALYRAITAVIQRAVRLRGRTDEYDLFGECGKYQRVLDSSTTGEPCPKCKKEVIVKESFLGGAIYFCPKCQEPPPKPTKRPRSR